MGLSVEVVRKPPKPIPEKVAKRWAEEWPRRARRWTGGNPCHREGTWLYLVDGWWSGPSLMVGSEQTDELGDYERLCASAEAFV